MGPVQLLVNNAGVSTAGMRFDEIGPELWDRVIDINLTGVYNGVHFFLDGMRAAGGGHIVNTSSAAGLLAPPELGPYVATKAAIIGLSESLRLELAESGIGVSVLIRAASGRGCGAPPGRCAACPIPTRRRRTGAARRPGRRWGRTRWANVSWTRSCATTCTS
jgi:NAD(P)-dependent dehydrogenase (short-subunit alcohol dehydrogenase family)